MIEYLSQYETKVKRVEQQWKMCNLKADYGTNIHYSYSEYIIHIIHDNMYIYCKKNNAR